MLERRLTGHGVLRLAATNVADAGDPGVRGDAAGRLMPYLPVSVANDFVASPRACLQGAPMESADAHSVFAGATEHHPRTDKAKDAAVGVCVVFSSRRRAECMCATGNLAEDFASSQRVETGGSEEIAPCLSMAADADPGLYRCDGMTICDINRASHPHKQSGYVFARRASWATDMPPAGRVTDKDVAHVTTGAMDCAVPGLLPHEEVAVDSGVTCAGPLPNRTDRSVFSPDENDLSGSGVLGGTDPGVLLSNRESGP